MSCVFQNIDPPPPSPPGESVPHAFVAGGGHIRRVERGVRPMGGSIIWRTQGTALYSTYIESSLFEVKCTDMRQRVKKKKKLRGVM
jgi:hypothetical protein